MNDQHADRVDRAQRKAALIERCAQQRVAAIQLTTSLSERISNSSGAYNLVRLTRMIQWARENRTTIGVGLVAAIVPVLLLKRQLAGGMIGRLLTMLGPMLVSRLIQRFARATPTTTDPADVHGQGNPGDVPSARD